MSRWLATITVGPDRLLEAPATMVTPGTASPEERCMHLSPVAHSLLLSQSAPPLPHLRLLEQPFPP